MLLHIHQLLSADEVRQARQQLVGAPWQAGQRSAGPQAAQVKRNAQLPEASPVAQTLRQLVLQGLERSPQFFSAALPKTISPPMFNRYAGDANTYGNHVDSAVRFLPDGKGRVRTDVSCTVFLSAPDEYEGGELVVEDTFGTQRVKLNAGDAVLYPGTSIHRVEPVTRGERLASFFWIQSMVRSDEQRRLLYDMDQHLMRLRSQVGETDPAIVGLTGTYHNLLRLWADV
ncbi:Fe2+-dependent dioxygenase [Comamonas sp. J-3]|uniref:Fe2+-dependent dioxygenase n=1 Tax=Comamonas trifloxystrobinivorans TaxID=3350256 RepID=UPI0037277F25